MLQYQELVTAIANRTGLNPQEARYAAEATIATLARTVDEPQRRRLLEAVPAAIREHADDAPGPAPDADTFVTEVSWLTGTPPEQALYRAQAVLATLAEREPDLVDSLDVPEEIRSLWVDPARVMASPDRTEASSHSPRRR
jgi:uncharacterized protein (DUF2267 family)